MSLDNWLSPLMSAPFAGVAGADAGEKKDSSSICASDVPGAGFVRVAPGVLGGDAPPSRSPAFTPPLLRTSSVAPGAAEVAEVAAADAPVPTIPDPAYTAALVAAA